MKTWEKALLVVVVGALLGALVGWNLLGWFI